ncbi:hypothetical protein [Desulfomicrobium apsheronum]|uniref:hypothetical protein n=1 Tax=Desulfomicrobium apsheronum TaxID=52560 RepID=UPI000B824F9B|nr:hypothetical protein [Desulfomicrobium apsheronum]
MRGAAFFCKKVLGVTGGDGVWPGVRRVGLARSGRLETPSRASYGGIVGCRSRERGDAASNDFANDARLGQTVEAA